MKESQGNQSGQNGFCQESKQEMSQQLPPSQTDEIRALLIKASSDLQSAIAGIEQASDLMKQFELWGVFDKLLEACEQDCSKNKGSIDEIIRYLEAETGDNPYLGRK
ncbi:hypothetical protein GC174_08150 [bacterium]|nr:hypothetical protein [bacterium]